MVNDILICMAIFKDRIIEASNRFTGEELLGKIIIIIFNFDMKRKSGFDFDIKDLLYKNSHSK